MMVAVRLLTFGLTKNRIVVIMRGCFHLNRYMRNAFVLKLMFNFA